MIFEVNPMMSTSTVNGSLGWDFNDILITFQDFNEILIRFQDFNGVSNGFQWDFNEILKVQKNSNEISRF